MTLEENDFEVFEDALAPKMEIAEISGYTEKLREAITKILEKSLMREPKEIFKTVVEEGARTLDAECCSIFLLEEGTSILRLMDASGHMGNSLKKEDPWYYVTQKRSSLTKGEREKKKDEIDKIMEEYRRDWQVSRKKLNKNEFVENRKWWVDNANLPIGITAYVVKEGRGVIANGAGVREHPEWLGGYEDVQGEVCTSLIEVPLKVHGRNLGVIKIENHVDSPKLRDFGNLRNEECRAQIKLFGPQHKDILLILADAVALAIQVLHEEKSYKKLFGDKFLREAKFLLSGTRIGSKNSETAMVINDFCEDVIKWDSIGIDNIYKQIIGITKKLVVY